TVFCCAWAKPMRLVRDRATTRTARSRFMGVSSRSVVVGPVARRPDGSDLGVEEADTNARMYHESARRHPDHRLQASTEVLLTSPSRSAPSLPRGAPSTPSLAP